MKTATKAVPTDPDRPGQTGAKWALAAAAWLAGCALLSGAAPVSAYPTFNRAQVEIYDRQDGRVLPMYSRDGVRWVEGTPGHEYSIRVRNDTSGRLLAVMSVDGVNVITGETASHDQSGYVVDAHAGTEIAGWRKSMQGTAAFYFTELPDAYASRTGRPENVGVIGVALFRERQRPVAITPPLGRVMPDSERSRDAGAPAQAPAAEAGAANEAASKRADALPATPSLAPQLGTGHGRGESSYAQYTAFVRESSTPMDTIVIRYDRRENLIAMGIVPSPRVAQRPDPFPASGRFVPDPPPYWR